MPFWSDGDSGQATVEAAFLIPVILLALMLLVQPAILLYDRMVMHAAAQEACRLLETKAPSDADVAYEQAVRRSLAAIPEQENFHVHEGGCSWEIELHGDETSREVSTRIAGKVRPLPLFDWGSRLLGIVDEAGCIEMKVESCADVRSEWLENSEKGLDPGGWVAQWK